MWELLCQNGHLARELFFRRVVAFEKNYSLIFATQLGEIFNHIFCHTYSNLIVLRGLETDGIILLVENSVLSYTCGGLQ